MANRQSVQKQGKSSLTVLGTLLFSLFNMILLSILSWIILEIWFSVQVIFFDASNTHLAIHGILTSNLNRIIHHYSKYSDIALTLYYRSQTTLLTWCNGNITGDLKEVIIGTTGVILTRCLIFIAFIPFLTIILCMLIIDGLVQRDKRKFQGARESTFLFHLLKPSAIF